MNNFKLRKIIISIFIILFAIITFIDLRGEFLQYKELGDNFIDVFKTNLYYKYLIFGINFIILYFMIYFTNRSIKKGLKEFFEKEGKEIPKIPNKSISFITSAVISSIMSNVLMQKILLALSNSRFGISDPTFNLDISFFVFIKPLITTLLIYLIAVIAVLSLYMALYYIIMFNKYFDAVDGKMVKNSLLVKKIIRNAMVIIVLIVILTILSITNIDTTKMLTIKSSVEDSSSIEIIGASYTDVVLQRWAYLIFGAVILIATYRVVKAFKKDDTTKIIKNLIIIPGYLVGMFIVITVFNLIIVNPNTLDKEKASLEKNIEYTKNAFNIDIEEDSINYSGTITTNDVDINPELINNAKIVNKDIVLSNLKENQTGTRILFI